MNVVNVVNVSVVDMKGKKDTECSVCECDPCDCGWGNYCGTEKRKLDRVSVVNKPWWEYDGCDLDSSLSSAWADYDDCLEHIERLYGTGGYTGTYTGKVVLKHSIGDPVKYFPNGNLVKDEGVWIIKDIINKNALDCSWYDYEITDGHQCHLVTFNELKKIGG